MSLLHWFVLVALGYLAFALFLLFAIDNVVLLAIPLGIAHLALEYIRRPPIWRLERAVRSLRESLANRNPSIIETRTMEWDRGAPTVYLVCRTHSQVAALRVQLTGIRAEIEEAAATWRVPSAYVSAMRLWAVSRQAVDEAGGWFGFDRSVPSSEPREGET